MCQIERRFSLDCLTLREQFFDVLELLLQRLRCPVWGGKSYMKVIYWRTPGATCGASAAGRAWSAPLRLPSPRCMTCSPALLRPAWPSCPWKQRQDLFNSDTGIFLLILLTTRNKKGDCWLINTCTVASLYPDPHLVDADTTKWCRSHRIEFGNSRDATDTDFF